MIHRFSESESDAPLESPPTSFIGSLFKRRVAILVTLGVLLAAALALVVILPRQFESHLDILVRNKLPASARASATLSESVDEQRMQAEIALLHSSELAGKVVDPDWAAQPESIRSATSLITHRQAVADFQKHLETSIEADSNLIHVTVTAQDPHRAADLATRLLEVFFASQTEADRASASTNFFINETAHLHNQYAQARQTLESFLLEHPVTYSSSAAGINQQIDALNLQIKHNDEQIDGAIGRILNSERKLVTIPARQLDPRNKSRKAAMPLLSQAQLKAQLDIYTDEQGILLTRPPSDPEAIRASLALAGQIANTNAALKLAQVSNAPERDPSVNPLWQSENEKINQSNADLKSLYANRETLANQLTTLQTALTAAQRPPAILAGLQTRAQSLQNASRLADERANEARIADAMDQQLRLNVAVAARPSFSNTATSPSPWLYAAAIALAVIFLAACLTLFAGMHSEEHAEDAEADDLYDPDPEPIPTRPSRVRSSASGAFLYASPGASVAPAPKPEPFPDLTFEPTPPFASAAQAAPVSTPEPPPAAAPQPVPAQPEPEAAVPEPAPEPPSPRREPTPQILHPHQYAPPLNPGDDSGADSQDRIPGFDAFQSFHRRNPDDPHPAVPSFFAGPPPGSPPAEPQAEPEEDIEDTIHLHPNVDEGHVNGSPVQEGQPSPAAASAEPEPIAEPTPEPPFVAATAAPASSPEARFAASPFPPPAPPVAGPYAGAPLVEPVPQAEEPELQSDELLIHPRHQQPAPVPDPAPIPQPTVGAAPPQPATPPFAPTQSAVTQTISSTLRPHPFRATLTSTLSAPAFKFAAPSAPSSTLPMAHTTASIEPDESPRPEAHSEAQPSVLPNDQTQPVEPPLILSYAPAASAEVAAPDPILPSRPAPAFLSAVQAPTPPAPPLPSPALSPSALENTYEEQAAQPTPEEEAEYLRTPTPLAHAPSRPQTYVEMVRSLTVPGDATPTASEFIPEPVPILPPKPWTPPPPAAAPIPAPTPVDDDLPPFNYRRKSIPATPPPPLPPLPPTPPIFSAPEALPPQDDRETIQSFIRRPSVPQQPPSEPAPAWPPVAPPPANLIDEDGPRLRPADRISAIRDQSATRLTPSQRMKRGRPVPVYDKDGKVTSFTYLPDDKDKTRF